MEDTPRLYDTLFQVLRQHEKWLDRRHAKNLAWMVAAMIQTGPSMLSRRTDNGRNCPMNRSCDDGSHRRHSIRGR